MFSAELFPLLNYSQEDLTPLEEFLVCEEFWIFQNQSHGWNSEGQIAQHLQRQPTAAFRHFPFLLRPTAFTTRWL